MSEIARKRAPIDRGITCPAQFTKKNILISLGNAANRLRFAQIPVRQGGFLLLESECEFDKDGFGRVLRCNFSRLQRNKLHRRMQRGRHDVRGKQWVLRRLLEDVQI